MKLLDRLNLTERTPRDPDDVAESKEERAARHERRRECRERLARAEQLQAEKAVLDERMRFLDELWRAAIEEHDRTVKPLQAELAELESEAVERIRQHKPADDAAEKRRAELLREIADANATLESHRPEPPAANWGVGPGFSSVGRPSPRSERDRLAARSVELSGEIARLTSQSKLTKPGVGDPVRLAEVTVNGRLSRLLDNLRVEARKIADHRPRDLDRYSDSAVLQFKRSKRESAATLETVDGIMRELELRTETLLEEMENE